ncbi:alpha-N-arabinofuranosidase [Jiangella sp. DSM 45060]|uniref:arabinosylfuranosidase ArfA n=1 Tax=Jiangella sp. DSM 45060 TaxID=1798224 RepID=UPI00087CD5BB|nr:alpha-N-arabinofuranosidase [Jiangella sp. DSM 45060]SDT10158.1 alpha-N-arabinofuranosidase [Jiangella sp. DSM 45060]
MPHASLTVDPSFVVGPIDRRLFGSFVEHLGRAVYDGIYEPDHATADEDGFRKDVIELVRELGVSTVRYPGGNFVSGYRWEDGVGPRSARPRRLDLAWHSLETNEIGLDEFARWSAKAGTELMLAVNLGTRGVQEALDLLEYANVRSGSTLADLRVANGTPDPHGVVLWCLGNEMDGPWQLGHRSADDYGKLAAQTARAMRQLDPGVKLIACGSSNRQMPTFGAWERTVLEHTYDEIDYLSCHAYYHETPGDLPGFLASPVDMDRFIESVVATIDHVRALRPGRRRVDISFDEWNVWYVDRYHDEDKVTDPQVWPVAPRILEDSYTVADAVVVGGLLMSLLRHADRVTAASLAQLVNVIAPIMTEPGGPSWRQTTFFPFATTSRLARGVTLAVDVTSPVYSTAALGEVPVVDAVATHDAAAGSAAVFLVNRSVDSPATVSVDVRGLGASRVLEALTLWDDDVHARNTLDHPTRVGLRPTPSAVLDGGTLRLELPPVSWTAISLG